LLIRSTILTTSLCGGSLISTRSIITAAHCLDDSISTQVILGAHRLTATEPTQQRFTVDCDNYRIHPLYNEERIANDIAILILPVAATLNTFVGILALPLLGSSETFYGRKGTISGWGRFSDDSTEASALLRSVDNIIISNVECELVFGSKVITESVMCMATQGFRGTCT
jgi:secreted trypsin-like serine protease